MRASVLYRKEVSNVFGDMMFEDIIIYVGLFAYSMLSMWAAIKLSNEGKEEQKERGTNQKG